MKLRDYQQQGIDDIRREYGSGKKAVLYRLPTGGGKTALMAHAAKGVSEKGRRSAVIAHRQELILQTSMTLAKQGIWHGVIAADKVVRAAIKNQIKELGRSYFNTDAPVQTASVQTLVRRSYDPFGFLFIDEAHHACVGGWLKVINQNPSAFLLGVTATPERLDGKGLGRHAGGVFDVMVEGPSESELMADGWLTYADVWGPPHQLDFSEVKDMDSEDGKAQIAGIVDKPSITGDAVAHYSRICPGQPAIAFCINIQHAQNVAKQFCAAGYRFKCIDGTMEDEERMDAIRALAEGRIHGLTSCEIINEGTDIPVVTAAIMLRPTQSRGLCKQQMGRVLRPIFAPGFDLETRAGRLMAIAASRKPRAIIFDHVGNCNRHGLPDDDYDWTMDGRPKAKRGAKDVDPTPAGRTCVGEGCFAIFSSRLRFCPACGTPAALTTREIEHREGELVRIERAEQERIKREEYWKQRKEQHAAKSQDELVKYWMAQGMSHVKAIARAKHIIRAREAKAGVDNTPDLLTTKN